MMRAETGRPAIVSGDGGTTETLDRVDLADHNVSEGWLQRLVAEHPGILPIDDFDASFAPLISIGREVQSGAGPIDVLFVSPNATVTIVETKLWRNPEARRQVVGQIIDYAAALARWSYKDLDAVARAFRQKSLWELAQVDDLPEARMTEQAFVDAVARNLRLGRFLLLIVGDGIREEVERMVDYVQAQPHLQFTLGLVELRVFERTASGERVVVPSVVARTTEVTRAVVEVNVVPDGNGWVVVSVPPPDSGGGPKGTLNESEFFDALSDSVGEDDVEFVRAIRQELEADSRFVLEWKKGSFMVKRRKLLAGAPNLTMLGFRVGGDAFIGWLGQQLPKNGVNPQRATEYATRSAEIVGTSVHPQFSDAWAHSVSVARVKEVWLELRAYISEFVDALDPQTDDE